MTFSTVLDLALGLVLLYLVFSVVVSRINEYVATKLQWRAQGVERGLESLLGGTAPTKSSNPTSGIQANGTAAEAPAPVVAAVPGGQAAAAQPPPPGSTTAVNASGVSALALKAHPAIQALDAGLEGGRRVSYLPSKAFSSALFDLLVPQVQPGLDQINQDGLSPAGKRLFASLQAKPTIENLDALATQLADDNNSENAEAIATIRAALDKDPIEQARLKVSKLDPQHPARASLLSLLDRAEGDINNFRTRAEHWFDTEMSRLSGWYKRRVQRWILLYSIVLVLLFNVDTIGIAQALWRNPAQQAAAASAAAAAAGKSISGIDTSLSSLKSISLPIGWTAQHQGKSVSTDPRRFPNKTGEWLLKLLGLALSVVALSFGAPFWFDVLGKIARLRNTGDKPASTV